MRGLNNNESAVAALEKLKNALAPNVLSIAFTANGRPGRNARDHAKEAPENATEEFEFQRCMAERNANDSMKKKIAKSTVVDALQIAMLDHGQLGASVATPVNIKYAELVLVIVRRLKWLVFKCESATSAVKAAVVLSWKKRSSAACRAVNGQQYKLLKMKT